MIAISRSPFLARAASALALCFACFGAMSQSASPTPPAPGETVVAMFRHGEKPPAGLGMLSCQGLNRALALPARLAALVGPPQAAYAPNPSAKKIDSGAAFDYNRPLLTLGPSAIAAGIPIDASIGWNDHDGLALALTAPVLEGKTVYVAWEHHLALQAARDLFARLGSDDSSLPKSWADDDFDTVYILRLSAPDGATGSRKITFERAREGLDGKISAACPAP